MTTSIRTISALAREFGLSRSTLLYYDRIGLLSPGSRTHAGYRIYTEADRQRLERICAFRQAGLTLAEIRTALKVEGESMAVVLETRLKEIGRAIRDLRTQQQLLAGMLRKVVTGTGPAHLDKATWVAMLRAAGMDDAAMREWHIQFERRAPDAHHEFLRWLGIDEGDIRRIRQWAASRKTNEPAGP